MFLKTNDRLINLKNVSNINILKDINKNKFRIIFNMNYNIEIQNGNHSKFISDYVYWDSINKQDLEQNIVHLEGNKYFQDNFISHAEKTGFININEISSVKLSEKKHRVIFNLSHPVTFRDFDGKEKITSEFVYVNCVDFKQYNQYVQYIQNEIGE